MSKVRAPYAPEFRAKIVDLVRSGRSPEELAEEFEPTAQSIRNWVAQANIDQGKAPGLSTDEKKELAQLRRENRVLREEREILKKAAAWFAQEIGTPSSKRSNT